MKKPSLSTVILILILVIGLSLLLYPSFSNYWNSMFQSRAVVNYLDEVSHLDDEKYSELWESARSYNSSLTQRGNHFLLTPEQQEAYYQQLDIGGTGIMGYIEIPSIGVELPIYHSTSESVLQIAVGHLEWTSLPVGGESTHCVVSGHRGLPSAKLFSELDRLAIGDFFMLYILDETLTYEVDQIRIVDPEDTDDLLIEEGKDLCTLVTCTPYGVNTHRLLVRGHRVENLEQAQTVRVTADAIVIEKLVVAPFVLLPILLIMMLWLMFGTGRRKK